MWLSQGQKKNCIFVISMKNNEYDAIVKRDLNKGQIGEIKLLELIRTVYPNAYIQIGYCPEYDIVIPELNQTVEVKWDMESNRTGNYIVETTCNGKPSCINVTTATYWVFYDSNDFAGIRTDILKDYIQKYNCREITFSKYGQTITGYLVNKHEIRKIMYIT